MSLTGNLEDLPLLDILQIVSFSKKTGYLSITAEAGRGAIVFDEGFVVAAYTWDTPLLDPRARSVAPEKRDEILRTRIEMALEQLIRLREGEFDFSLAEKVPRRVGGRDIETEILSQGINAQELLLDLARGLDEDRRDSTAALEVSFAAPEPEAVAAAEEDADLDALLSPPPLPTVSPRIVPSPIPLLANPAGDPTQTLPPQKTPPPGAPAPAGGVRTILLVDDEEDVRRVLGEHFTRGGYTVADAEDPEAAVKKASALAKSGPFLMVVDLGMPTTGGTSFQGGLEVVKKLAKVGIRPPVLLMTESLSAVTLTRAKGMGISSFVFKPGLSKLDAEQFDADLKAFAGKILSDLLPKLSAPVPAPDQAKPSPVPDQAKPAPAPVPAPPAPLPVPAKPVPVPDAAPDFSRELAVLQQRLDELRRPQDPTQIAALIMGVAREFFERAVLFLVKNEELRGVNGFGPVARGESLALLAHDLVVPLAERSIFSDVVRARRGFTGALPVSAATTDLMDVIGRLKAGDCALLPLVTHREAIAVLFGDNPDSGRPPGRLDTLRVFINQAGIALENAFLHRKVHALTGEE
jgi:CheY-like chemotaxis protein